MPPISSFGRLFVALLVGAGVSATGFVLTVLDVIDMFSGTNRRLIAVFWFAVFVVCVGGVVINLLKKVDSLQTSINALASASPRIKFQKIGGPTAIKLATRNVEVWQLWFVNDPVVRGSAAVAKCLTAVVQFSTAAGEHPIGEFVGQWAITQKADHVGWGQSKIARGPHDNLKNEIDLALMPARGKLMLIGQSESPSLPDQQVYALSGENIHAKPDNFQHSKYLLKQDVTRVLVRVAAENMTEQEFRFALTRNHVGRVMSIMEITL